MPEACVRHNRNLCAAGQQRNKAVPAGTLLPFAGTAVPDGYLLCNGAEVSRADYANLFAAIGTKWGEGDGSTTFTLPNFNDRFIEGTTDTEKVGQYLEAGAPNITGTSSKILYLGQGLGNSGAFSISDYASGASSGGGFAYKLSFNASQSNNVYTALTVQPNSCYSLIIIKA